ncbi:MAG: hypothetical protein CM15mV10_1100 [uncultured marine virus]|nr:MAG: hypothetical protein CM15mV10_1100 [uncultured marine virus]
MATLGDAKIDPLVASLKNKKFNDVKKWVQQNIDNDPISIMRKLYDSLPTTVDSPSVAAAVLIIAEYQYKASVCCRPRDKLISLSYSNYVGV